MTPASSPTPLAAFDEVDYVVDLRRLAGPAGRGGSATDDSQLLDTVSRIRSVDGVESTETFVYLGLRKQTYAWGTHRPEPPVGPAL